jgi:hypothetical protein
VTVTGSESASSVMAGGRPTGHKKLRQTHRTRCPGEPRGRNSPSALTLIISVVFDPLPGEGRLRACHT